MQIIGVSVTLNKPVKGPVTLRLLLNKKNAKQNVIPQETKDQSGNAILTYRWDLNPFLSVRRGKELTVQLVKKRTFGVRVLAEGSLTYDDTLIDDSPSEYKEYTLSKDPHIRIEVAPTADDAALEVKLGAVLEMSKERRSILDRLGKARGFLEELLGYSTAFSELDPLAKALLGCVNVVYARLERQEKIDRLIYQLADSMILTLSYIRDIEQFARVTQLKKAIEEVRPLIEDITNLIVSFTSRSVTAEFIYSSDAAEEIEALNKRFIRFKEQFDRGVAVNTGVRLETALEQITNVKDHTTLQQLKPKDIGGIRAMECMPGTRRDVLSSVDVWVDDFTAPNILWIRGFPGVGKSSVSASTVHKLRSSQRLGSSFAFQRAKATTTTPSALWRTVAYDLAHMYPSARRKILSKLEEEIVDVNFSDDKILFQNLVEEPLRECTDIPPGRLPVIVIDALDECGGLDGRHSRHRASLLTSLRRWARLPREFKLIVTSRYEDDIARALMPLSHSIELHSGTSVSEEDIRDIYVFFENKFKEIADDYPDSLSPQWPGPHIIQVLADNAAGLFIWARTVAQFISLGEPRNQLEQILTGNAGLGNMSGLYTKILDTSFRTPTAEVLQAFRAVTGSIILARDPLRRVDYLALLNIEPSMLDFIRKGLQSIMSEGDHLSFSHQSFVDFLLDPQQCPPQFLIDVEEQERLLASATLRVMRTTLQFNICGFSTSHYRNTQVQDLEQRISNAIPGHLIYSCQFWAAHLSEIDFQPDLLLEVEDFMQNRFLYWLEVLSITGAMHVAVPSLTEIIYWCTEHAPEAVEFAQDALKFMAAFGTVIAQSAPHIYLSALPFAPENSRVAQQYRPSYPQTLMVEPAARVSDWPAIQLVIDEQYGRINSIACSSDGRFIASGSTDKTILILAADTGQPVYAPLSKHEGSVNCVAFSTNCQLIASGSDDQTIIIWEVETGDIVAGPLTGHSDMVTALVFHPDGRLISGSHDKTLRIWATFNGLPLSKFSKSLHAHTLGVTSIALSPDTLHIASGSYDRSIHLWDAATGDRIAGPFTGHLSAINCVAFSPDSKLIASASEDDTLYIWHADTGEISVGPLEGHNESVTSVAFSPADSMIASGSHDGTMRLWDANTGEPLRAPYRGHTDGITAIAFSIDGRRIFSGSRDETIRVWDAWARPSDGQEYPAHKDGVNAVAVCEEKGLIASGSDDETVGVWNLHTGKLVAGPFQGHEHWVQAIAFSPEGDRVVSGSEDQTIRVWDLEAGEQVLCMEGHRAGITTLTVSPHGHIISGSYDGTIKVWNISTGELMDTIEGHESWITSVAAAHSLKLFASGSHDKTVCIWSLDNRPPLDPIEGHTGPVNCVAFSFDDLLVASGAGDWMIRVWDTFTGALVLGPFVGHSALITAIAFTPDRQYLISSAHDKTIRIWDTETGGAISGPFNGHTSGVYHMTLTPSGKRIVSCSDDECIRVWDAEGLEGIEDDPADVDPATLTAEFSSYSHLKNGWVVAANGALLFWVPPWHRDGLWWPRSSAVICERPTKLDLSRFVHGESWENVKLMLKPEGPPPMYTEY
ncbi:hypothetical protein AX16_001142 [Volvariella volvacea WC 439]|nr:hypothetical protein AX16_001142 [Volvariella volvacea WC 439]